MNIKENFMAQGRLKAGWRILLFVLLSFPPQYYLTFWLWDKRLPRYFIIFWLLLGISHLFARSVDKRPAGTVGFMLHSRWLREYLQGVLIGVVLVSVSLWLPSGLHFGWNFFMGKIFSMPVSGNISPKTLLAIKTKGAVWLTGADYGPEAGIPALILILAACFFIYFRRRIKVCPEMLRLWENHDQKIRGKLRCKNG